MTIDLSLYLGALRRWWPTALVGLLLPWLGLAVWVARQPVLYEAQAVIRGPSVEINTEALVWLESRTLREAIGAVALEHVTVARAKTAPVLVVSVTGASPVRTTALATDAIARVDERIRARTRADLVRRQAILRAAARTTGEANVVAAALDEALRTPAGIDVIDQPAATPLPRLTRDAAMTAITFSALGGMVGALVPAWWVARRALNVEVS